MDESKLRALAKDMGMKKSESASREDVAFYIIDTESATTAKEMVAKSAAKPEKRRPGRPRKVREDDEPTPASEPMPKEEAPAAEVAQPKKRGRKPKVKPEEAPVAEAPEVKAEPAVAAEAPQPKKRGRKPKVKVEEQPQPEVPMLPLIEIRNA